MSGDEFNNFVAKESRWVDHEHRSIWNRLQRDTRPARGEISGAVQNYGVCSSEKLLGRGLEVFIRRIKHRDVKIGLNKLQNAVRLQDRILRRIEPALNGRHRLCKLPLRSPHPKGMLSTGGEKARTVRLSRPV